MDNYKLPFVGYGHKVPPIPGFGHCRDTEFPSMRGSVARGLFVSRFQIGPHRLTISTGFGSEPVKKAAFLSVLAIQWYDPTDGAPGPGLVAIGSPFGAKDISGTGKLLRGEGPKEMLAYTRSSYLIQTIIKAWTDYGMLEGNHADLKKFSRYFESGAFSHLVTEAIVGSVKSAERAGDVHSVYNLEPYDIDIGLGIDKVEPMDLGLNEAVQTLKESGPRIHDNVLRNLIEDTIGKLETIHGPSKHNLSCADGTFPREIPTVDFIEEATDGKYLMLPTPRSMKWAYYRLNFKEVIRDLKKDTMTGSSPIEDLVRFASRLIFMDDPGVVHKGTNNGILFQAAIPNLGYPPPMEWMGHLPIYYKAGWDGFRGHPTDDGYFVIRYLGTYVYSSDEFDAYVKTLNSRFTTNEIIPYRHGTG